MASNDPSKPLVSVALSLSVIYDFQGFFGGVKNPPVLNRVNQGSTVPFVFSLRGKKGLNIFPAGSPSSVEIECDFYLAAFLFW
ncbi:MAG TPA: PxKF domain-containing protein [Pyrinomonadaceae bacterium]|nr:PxKF domain-containing protein [Pyrinomonadaceae bacterium]